MAPRSASRVTLSRWMLATVVAALIAVGCTSSNETASGPFDFRDDWAVLDSFDIAIDASGFALPTAIAFVPDAGDGPQDPLYFVTELRGTVKVVTNDRSILDFASVPSYVPELELPAGEGQAGLAGICLAPEEGYVFVTFAAQDEGGLLRNNIVRLDAEPHTFGLEARGAQAIGEVLLSEQSALSHQVGGCQVDGDALYVSVGDGGDPSASQSPERALGKVLRLTFEGDPHPDNPFVDDVDGEEPSGAAPYVYAYGLRNPFGIEIVDDEVFVADNGPQVDRFLRLEAGRNYLWDGTNASMAVGAETVMPDSIGPVQLERYPSGSALFPEDHRGAFYVAASADRQGGVVMFPYDTEQRRPTGTPDYVVRYQGQGNRFVSALAFGPDGLYFFPVVPDAEGESHVFRLTHDEASEYPHVIGAGNDLITNFGCRSCHVVGGRGGVVGPALDFFDVIRIERLQERLGSPAYLERLDLLDELAEEPFVSTRDARQDLRDASGLDQVRTYIENKVQEPRFENANAQMPRLGIEEDQARRIANILMAGGTESGTETLGKRLRDIFSFYPDGRDGDMLAGATLGFIAGAGGLAAAVGGWWLARRALRKRAQSSSAPAAE